MKFSIVIPTYNREIDLEKCLKSILKQTLLPNEIIIIDDGNLKRDKINNWHQQFLDKDISFVYYKKNHQVERKGTSESRNKALELINNEIFFIFDDDVVLETKFLEFIIKIWKLEVSDRNLIGVGGLIKNSRKKNKLEKYFNILFGLTSSYSWDVNKVCFQVWDEDIRKPTFGYYAHGGVCSYSLRLAKELKFSTFSGGRTALEDVDFCVRAKENGYHFIIEPQSKLYHYPSVTAREKQYLIGYKESFNRKIIFESINKKPNFYLLVWFHWANFGWILRQFLVGNFRKGCGMLVGTLS